MTREILFDILDEDVSSSDDDYCCRIFALLKKGQTDALERGLGIKSGRR